MLDFKGKSCDELAAAITAAGHYAYMHDNVFVTDDEAAVQAIIDAFDMLPVRKSARIAEFKAEGLSRIRLLYPTIGSLDDLDLELDRWKSITNAAKSPTTDYARMLAIFAASKAAIVAVKACTTLAQVAAVTAAWPV